MLLFNQIAGFFDHQYIWKECIDILDFLHEGIHEGKVASKPTTFGWVCPGKPSYAQICPEFLNAFCWSGYVDVKHISDWNINKSRRRVFFQHFKTQDFKLSTEITAWKVSKYGVFFWSVFSRIRTDMPYLSVFSPNAGKYEPEKTPYLDTFHAVKCALVLSDCRIAGNNQFLRLFASR